MPVIAGGIATTFLLEGIRLCSALKGWEPWVGLRYVSWSEPWFLGHIPEMGWDDGSLSEDTELSVRLAKRGHVVRYAPEVGSWQENPESLGQLSRQRTRWFRGCMEVSLRYGRLITKLKSRSVDVEVTLAGPHILALCFMGYLATLYTVLVPIRLDPFFTVMTQFTSLMSLIPLCVIGMALVYVTKPHRVTNILWLPFIHACWTPQTFMALYALVQIV